MKPTHSELTWSYKPKGFFEGRISFSTEAAGIVIAGGTVTATLDAPEEPIPASLRVALQGRVDAIFRARQMLIHRRFRLAGPSECHHHSGGTIVKAVKVHATETVIASDRVNVVVKDADGSIISDSKAERVAAQRKLLEEVATKISTSRVLQRMLASYGAAVDDPEDELIHLYEIRDALAEHYGSEDEARSNLAFPRKRWRRLGQLANHEPLQEGRHRGKRLHELRPATRDELSEARAIGQDLIRAFIQRL